VHGRPFAASPQRQNPSREGRRQAVTARTDAGRLPRLVESDHHPRPPAEPRHHRENPRTRARSDGPSSEPAAPAWTNTATTCCASPHDFQVPFDNTSSSATSHDQDPTKDLRQWRTTTGADRFLAIPRLHQHRTQTRPQPIRRASPASLTTSPGSPPRLNSHAKVGGFFLPDGPTLRPLVDDGLGSADFLDEMAAEPELRILGLLVVRPRRDAGRAGRGPCQFRRPSGRPPHAPPRETKRAAEAMMSSETDGRCTTDSFP